MKIVLILLSLVLFCSHQMFSQNDGDDVVIGKYHVINSKVLGEQRRILVHVPVGYETNELKYPVVYHLYGDFVMTYYADAASTLDRLHSNKMMPEVILIGVDNTDRYRDLRPVKPDGSPGGSENFMQYLTEELIPFVEKKYRTANYRILVGPQAGACFGLYALMEHTDLFDAIIIDNSFGNPQKVNEYLLTKAKSFFQSGQSLKKFLFMKVNKESANLSVALDQKAHIESNNRKELRFVFRLNETENNVMLETDFLYGFRELFAGYSIPKDVSITGLDDVKDYYKKFSDKLGYPVSISDRILTDAGERLSEQRNKKEVKKIWEYILELYPKSLDGLFRVAQMNVSEGRYEEAIRFYGEFLKIRPQEGMVQNKVKSIEKIINESAVYEIEQAINSGGSIKGRELYHKLKRDSQKYFDETEFVAMGNRFISTNKLAEAIETFTMTTESFPESFNAWYGLGEAYMNNGEVKLAEQKFEKALELNPDNENTKSMLKQLRGNK